MALHVFLSCYLCSNSVCACQPFIYLNLIWTAVCLPGVLLIFNECSCMIVLCCNKQMYMYTLRYPVFSPMDLLFPYSYMYLQTRCTHATLCTKTFHHLYPDFPVQTMAVNSHLYCVTQMCFLQNWFFLSLCVWERMCRKNTDFWDKVSYFKG